MPRDTYFQSTGNPLQAQHLPTQDLRIQFPHTSTETPADCRFAWVFMRNLLLVSGMCLAADWIGVAFQVRFPLNLILVVVMIRGLIRLWQSTTIYKPHLALVAVPCAIHFFVAAFLPRVILVAVVAAYVGREFARHYIYLATSFPYDRATADRERAEWDDLTLLSSLLVAPFAIAFAMPRFAPPLFLLMLVGFAIAVIAAGPINVVRDLTNAWYSWCTYNRKDTSAPGVLNSPAGSTAARLGMVVFLVASMTLLLASIGPMSGIVWGDAATFLDAGNIIVGTILTFVLIALPIAVSMALIAVAALPAIIRFAPPATGKSRPCDWQAVTASIRSSSNPIERDSIFLGRLAHDGAPLLVPRAVFREHAHILGDSGSGKTARGLIPLAEQLIGDGESSLMVIDLKGDSQEMLSSLNECARRFGTSNQSIPVRHFSVREDHATFAFNPFQLPCWKSLSLFQRTDVLCGALGLTYGTDYGRGFFSSANAAVLHATLKATPDIGSFAELVDRIAFVTSRPKAHGLNDGQTDAGNHVRMIADRLAAFKPLNITPQHTPNFYAFQQAMDPAQLFRRQEIFYFHLSTTLGPGSSPEIARLAMFMLLTTATLTQNRRQVYLMIDEFQRVAAHNVDAILQIARSMNIGVILANQSMLDLKKDELVHVVEANCRYRQWYAISSPEEQQRLSKASGETIDLLHSESVSRQRDGFETRTTTTCGSSQFIAPRLSVNDIKLASDDPRKSIALVTRGAGYSQFGGMPVVVESDFHISEQEFMARKNAPWPKVGAGSFVPMDWVETKEAPRRDKKKRGPVVTEETIGVEPSLFDSFLADKGN